MIYCLRPGTAPSSGGGVASEPAARSTARLKQPPAANAGFPYEFQPRVLQVLTEGLAFLQRSIERARRGNIKKKRGDKKKDAVDFFGDPPEGGLTEPLSPEAGRRQQTRQEEIVLSPESIRWQSFSG